MGKGPTKQTGDLFRRAAKWEMRRSDKGSGNISALARISHEAFALAAHDMALTAEEMGASIAELVAIGFIERDPRFEN